MKFFVLLFLLLAASFARAQEEKVNWLSIEQAEKLSRKTPKPLIIDFYTDWCGWCKHMDKTTYADPVVVSYINHYFYPVKINAESDDTLFFRGKQYVPVKNGSRNISGLALELLGGKLSYPTTVFLYDKENINLVVPGYLESAKMQGFLIYFSENAWESVNINSFIRDFELTFDPAVRKGSKDAMYWTEFKELERKQQQEKKKTLLFLGAQWNNSSKMMKQVVFPDSLFSTLAEKYFYCLHLDAQYADTLTFMTHKFRNTGAQNNNLHQLAIALSDQVLRVPSIYLFDEDGKMMERFFFYMDRERGALILDYIGSNTYKDMPWEDYIRLKAKEGF